MLEIWRAVVLVLWVAVVACGVFQVHISGNVMAPTLKDGQYTNYDPNAYSSASPKRGDVVVFKTNGVFHVRRVIGLPGETVSFKDGNVYIDGKQLKEPYLPAGTQTLSETESFQVPANQYFVLSDNRAAGSDSRSLGFVSRGQIVGRVNL